MDWIAFADSRTAAFLFTSLKFVALVIVGTIALSLVSIWLIENLETAAREFRAWLKKPRKLNGMWA